MTSARVRIPGKKKPSLRTRNCTALLVGSLVALTGCTSGGGSSSSPRSHAGKTATSSPAPSPRTSDEKAAVLAAYRESWDASIVAYAKASSAGTELRKTTTARALLDIESDLTELRNAGQITTGKPAIHPADPEVTVGKFPKATLTDCVDITAWTLVDKASKKKVPLPSERLLRYVSTATLEKWGTTWMVTKVTAHEKAC
ncbi:hypothetical protein ABZV80_24230 [Streptomyces sp. NPDC005132]|uniref:hypothetical protein n=1 Tax=Streptomyces sp. NPDC005132 TaxID=3154294 RepID=UPI0033A6AAE6